MGHEQAAFGDSLRGDLLQLLFEFWGGQLAIERFAEKQGDLLDLSGLFVDEFEPILVDAGSTPAL
jgi:hypothetical protein